MNRSNIRYESNKFHLQCEDPKRVVKRAIWLAYQNSDLGGGASFMACRNDVTEETVWKELTGNRFSLALRTMLYVPYLIWWGFAAVLSKFLLVPVLNVVWPWKDMPKAQSCSVVIGPRIWSVYADYVFGRMMKVGFSWTRDEVIGLTEKPHHRHQSWYQIIYERTPSIRRLDSYRALVEYAIRQLEQEDVQAEDEGNR